MARAPKTAAVDSAEPAQVAEEVKAPSLRDELLAIASAALVAGDHVGHALADSLLQDVVAMRCKLAAAGEVDGDLASIVAKLKTLL